MDHGDAQTVCDLLERAARDQPKHGLTFLETNTETFISYNELLRKSHANGVKLRDSNILANRQIVLLYFDNHRSNVEWTWSVIAAGGIPAILPQFSNDNKTREGQLQNLQTLFGKPTLLTSQSTTESFASLSGATVHTVESISALPAVSIHGRVFGYQAHEPDSLAALLFTSGSTGHSKAVEFTHRQLICSVAAKQQLHQLDASVSFLSWISFDHSANFCELHLNAMNAGSNQFMVPASDMVHQPHRFFQLLATHEIGYTFSPNSFLATAGKTWLQQDLLQQTSKFDKLKVVMVGGEANKVATLEQADRIFSAGGAGPNVVKAAYGLSETCSACFYNMNTPFWDLEQSNVFATVGKHVPSGIELRLVDDDLSPVSGTQDGRIQLRGEIVFQRYYNNPAATAECMTSDAWFDTGDMGRLDSGGNLAIVGRSKEILILGGNNYSSFELEHAIEGRRIPGLSISWTAAFSVWDHDKDTEGVVVLFNPTDDIAHDRDQLQSTIDSMSTAVLLFASTTPLDIIPLPKEEMPKSTIGKLSRQKLKNFYSEGRFDKYRVKPVKVQGSGVSVRPLETQSQRTVAELLARQLDLPIEEIGADSEIAQFGLSSIAYLRLKRSLEVVDDEGGPSISMGAFLEARTVADVAVLLRNQQASQYSPIMTLCAEGSKPPLFLFPPAGGEIVIWLSILKYIHDRPVYAVQPKGLERSSKSTFEGLDEMLNTYEAAILSKHSAGPYALLGLCFGGTTAFEIGKRLEARGHTLSFCGGLDNVPFLRDALGVGGDRSNMRSFLLDLLVYHKVISVDKLPAIEARYVHLSDNDAVAAITNHFREQGMEDAGLHAEKIEAWYRVNCMAHKVARAYVPTGNVRCYDIFWADPCSTWEISPTRWKDMLKGWDRFARDGARYWKVEGHHFSLLEAEHAEQLAGTLVEAMSKRELELVSVDGGHVAEKWLAVVRAQAVVEEV